MTKKKIERTTKTLKPKKSFLNSFNIDEAIPKKYQIPLVIAIIILLFLIFLSPLYFGNKTFQSGDIIAREAMKSYVEQEREGYTLWNPLIFCGMPAYATVTDFKWFNLVYVAITSIRWFFTSVFTFNFTNSFHDLPYATWTFYLILLGITTFFFIKHLTKNLFASLFTAIATSFSTGIIVFLYIGHHTKLVSLWTFPLIFLFLLRMQEKIRWIDFLLLVVTLNLLLQAFHVQIIFYTMFTVAVYFIYFFIRYLIRKEAQLRNNLLKSAGIFLGTAIIAVLIQADNLTQIYEYTPYSTRGTEGILDKTASKQNEAETNKNFYAYHTEWSFSPEELSTFIVPSYFGFGSSTYKGPLTNNQPVEVNTYFGQMSFVDVAMYMGVVVFFLAIFGAVTRWKEPLVQFLTILTVLSLLISFGKNFPIIFDLLFYNLPYFDKFRVPSMILVVVQLCVPILAGLGLMKIISARHDKDPKAEKLLKNISIMFTIILGLVLILNGAFSDWFTGRVNDYAASIKQAKPQLAQQFIALADYMADMFTSDLIFAFAFTSIVFWSGFAYIKEKLSGDVFVLIAILISLIDLWRIDSRGAQYVENPQIDNLFNEPLYISEIKKLNDREPFRILNIKQDGSLGSLNRNSNFNAYFLAEDMYGYSGIKPRAYQDYMDVVGPVSPLLWRMLNVKYIVTDGEVQVPGFEKISGGNKNFVYKNNNALPRIYLVDNAASKPATDILNLVKSNSFDPMRIAFLEEDSIKTDVPDSSASVIIKVHKEDYFEVDVSASGNNFLFFGNNYVMPGWKAEVDGKRTKIYKTNHAFMGILVQKGKHTVKFYYSPDSFYISKYIVLFLSSMVVCGIIVIGAFPSKRNVIDKSIEKKQVDIASKS
jgi:hypothetical protein